MNTVSFPGLGIGEFTVNPDAFSIGSFSIKWYAICICLGLILAFFYGERKAKYFGISSDDFLDLILICVPAGLIGARVGYILMDLDSFDDFKSMISVWNGGLSIYGGLIAAFLAIIITCKFKNPIIKSGWLLSSISYCSYNMTLLIPVLISLRKQITKEQNIKYIAIITGSLMTIMSMMVYMLLIKSDVEISSLEMPIVYIIRVFFANYKTIYAFIILASIFTTAISIGIGFLQNISKNKKSYTQFVIFMCITSLIISNFGFSKLVNFVYPLFGYLGIVQIILIIRKKTYCKKRVL